MSDKLNVEQVILGTQNPDEALRKGVSRAEETVENLKRAHAGSRVVLRGGGWLGGDGVQLQLSFAVSS